jgi:alkylation response protein AidB-like acyl-CoA dehydrogenase
VNMRSVRLRNCSLILTLVFGTVVSVPVVAQEASPGVIASADWESPTHALSTLQKAHVADASTFVEQGELDCLIKEGGGGGCASAACIDLLQALRVMAGFEKLPNPHRIVLGSFTDQKELLAGRVTNDQLVRLIQFYQRYLDGAKLKVDVVSAPNSRHATDGDRWAPKTGLDLSLSSRQIRILSYTVTETNGEVLGRHFVLLKDRNANEITVVDPGKPTKDYRYVIDYKPGEQGAFQQAFLLNAAGAPPRFRNRTYELNTIFTMSLLPATDETRRSVHSTSIEYFKTQINKTASDLRGTDDFLSPRAWRERTAPFGLPGLDLPVKYGGSEWPASKMLEIFKHAGRYNLNLRDVVGGAHVRPLLKSTNPEVLEIVRQVAGGKGYIAIAITEPTAGSDVSAIKSTSRKVDGGYLLSGTKRFNARLDQATHVIVFTQGTTGDRGKLSVFVVPINTPGLHIERLEAHGLTGNSYGGLSFKDLFVPESHLIGKDGEGLGIFHEHFLYWRLMQTAAAIGTGENALEQMAERLKTREAFGAPIGRFTHLQQPIGQYTTELRMAHSLAKEAAALIDRGDYKSARTLINGLKAEGVESALSAVDAATRAFGGEGYSNLVDLGDRLRDLNGLRIADGTTDVMRMDVVRKTFGEVFWEMAVQSNDD